MFTVRIKPTALARMRIIIPTDAPITVLFISESSVWLMSAKAPMPNTKRSVAITTITTRITTPSQAN